MKIKIINIVIIKNIFKDDVSTPLVLTRRPTLSINFRFTKNRSSWSLSKFKTPITTNIMMNTIFEGVKYAFTYILFRIP